MKKLAIALMVLGLVLAGLGLAWPYQSSAGEDCLRFREKAVSLAEEAIKAKGTPREQELVAEIESETSFADSACERADGFRSTGYMMLGAGVVLLLVGFVLSRKKAAA